MYRIILLVLLSSIVDLLSSQKISLKQPVSYLALGDSYTIGQSVEYDERFPVQLKKSLEDRGVVFSGFEIRATTGWTTRNLLNSLDNNDIEIQPNLVSLLIGVNNQYRGLDDIEYAREFENLLIRSLIFTEDDTSSVFVVSIPDYAYTTFGGGNTFISAEIDNFNEINRGISERFGITYVNITDISREGLEKPEYVAEDGLHPSGEQYAKWVERILEKIDFETVSYSIHSKNRFKLYPNPFNGELQVDFADNSNIVKYRVLGLEGQLLAKGIADSDFLTLDFQFLKPGMYVFQAEDVNGFRYNQKIIKK